MVKERTADASLYTKYKRQSVSAKLTLSDDDTRAPPASRVSVVSQSPYGVNIPISFQFRFGGQSADRFVTLSDVLLSIVSGTTRNLILNFNLSRPLQLPVGVELYRNTSASTTGGTLIASSTVPPTFTASNVHLYYHYYAKATLNSDYRSNIVNTLNPLGQRFAGTYTGGHNGDGLLARDTNINNPEGITFNDSGTELYVAEASRRVRRINMSTNITTTIVGNGSDEDATATANIAAGVAGTSVGVASPKRLAYSEPFVLMVHANTVLRAYNTSATTATFGGVSVSPGHVRTVATISGGGLWGLATDINGNAFMADAALHKVHRILKTTGAVSVVAGSGVAEYLGDGGPAISARIRVPTGCDIDKARNVLYISDRDNAIIRAVNLNATGSVRVAGVTIAAGNIDRIAGTANQITERPAGGQPQIPFGDGGLARDALFTGTTGTNTDLWTCSVDPLGNIYPGDAGVVRRVDVETGIITGITGYAPTVLTDDVPAYNRAGGSIMQCAFGPDNSIYVASYGSNYVQRIY